jgi:DNA-binding transcriptional regulator/RsmH inhibitor MraZ
VAYEGCRTFVSSVSTKGVVRLPAKYRPSSISHEYFVTSLDGSSIRIYPIPVWVCIEERLARITLPHLVQAPEPVSRPH